LMRMTMSLSWQSHLTMVGQTRHINRSKCRKNSRAKVAQQQPAGSCTACSSGPSAASGDRAAPGVPPQLTITTAEAYHLSNSLTLLLLALLSYRGGGWPQDSQAQVWGKKKDEGLTGRWQGTQIVSKAARGGMYSEAIGGHQCQIHSNWLSQSACLPALCRSVECDWTPVDMLCLPSSSITCYFSAA
jgi:hypothetical protein